MVYKVDIMRNIAVQYFRLKPAHKLRRSSDPNLASKFTDVEPLFSLPDEEVQAVAGRLEIRVVDATGGTTIVETTTDKEIIQSTYYNNTLIIIMIKRNLHFYH